MWQKRLADISLVCIFLVVIAGSVVRMTGSGMGCPDWPKCFGYYIPPTSVETLTWRPHKSFLTGQVIIRNDSLWLARKDITTAEQYNPANWNHYTKHSYAKFNAFHTWTEYINRLFGAFSGLPVFLLFVVSWFRYRQNRLVAYLSTAVLFMLGFEAWLGKVVVDGNLIPNQITLHMAGAMTLVALLVFIKFLLSKQKKKPVEASPILWGTWLAFFLIQVLFGTQIRQVVDQISRGNIIPRSMWIAHLPDVFLAHRALAIALLLTGAALLYFMWRRQQLVPAAKWLGILLGAEMLLGLMLAYAGFPEFAQPMHLLFAMLMFAIGLSLWLRMLLSAEPEVK